MRPRPASTRRSAPTGTPRWTGPSAAGVPDWAEWWRLAAEDPVLAAPTAERFAIYGEHADGETPSVQWHTRTLLDAGFAEARTVWASPSDALVLALR